MSVGGTYGARRVRTEAGNGRGAPASSAVCLMTRAALRCSSSAAPNSPRRAKIPAQPEFQVRKVIRASHLRWRAARRASHLRSHAEVQGGCAVALG